MPKIDEADIKLCNCAVCEKELMGRSMEPVLMDIDPDLLARWPLVFEVRGGRPYCHWCVKRIELHRQRMAQCLN